MADLHQRVDRLNEAQRRALLARLDEQDAPQNHNNRRGMPRLPFRRTHVAINITQPGGGDVACTVPTRDLSAGGLSFIYWGFLYKGTHIQCALTRRRGTADLVESTVSWCKFIAGANHLIGVRFRQKIQPEMYLELEDGRLLARNFDPRTLTGRVLVLAQNELDRRLLSHYLKQTGLDFVCVDAPRLAAEITARQPFDLVLVDLDLQGDEAERAMVQMRMAGFDGSFLALTAETDSARHRKATEAGATDILRKPFAEDAFLRTLARWLKADTTGDEGPIFSELSGRGLDDLIGAFVTQCKQAARDLRALSDRCDLPGLRQACTLLRGNGGSYGFPAVTDAACEAVTAIDAAESTSEITIPLRKLISILTRLAPPTATSAAA
jgi:CheY-like chemotaxis protein